MTTHSSDNNKRIAKNTLLLYFRMLFLMVISLFTSRVTLQTLGVENFGIYNVVGGVVAMFSIMSGSLSNAISRYITFELGKGNLKKMKKVFSTSVNVQIIMAVGVAILIEIVGVWFLNYKMNIPEERMIAANWVLQFSIVSFAINLISIPYNATIVAHEKMSAFAYISIYEAVMKLVVVYLIIASPFDKLIIYALLVLLISLSLRLIYGVYCKRKFEECAYQFVLDKPLLLNMTSFAGWNFLGSGSFLLMTQGVNMLLNMFFGVTLNAARGIATQVESVVNQFTTNFGTAINPQITKSYAQDNLDYMHKLVFYGSKYSFFLVVVLCVPIILEANQILHLWLGIVPDYAVVFLRLTLVISMLSVISNTLVTSMMATGDIKKYQIIVGGLGMTIFPVVYLLYKLGYPPECSYYIQFFIFVFQLICRLWLLKDMVKLPVLLFLKDVILKDLIVLGFTIVFPLVLIYNMQESLVRFLTVGIVCELSAFMSIYVVGLSKEEREKVLSFVKTKIKRKQ